MPKVAESPTVFISHASEDKADFVRPLATALRERGVRVWYDEFSLRPGDSLRASIDKGLAEAAFGLVVLSPAFFLKNWTLWELNGLVQRHVNSQEGIIIPIWHTVDAAEVRSFSPPLADIVAINSTAGLAAVARAVAELVHPPSGSLVPVEAELEGVLRHALVAILGRADRLGEISGEILSVRDGFLTSVASTADVHIKRRYSVSSSFLGYAYRLRRPVWQTYDVDSTRAEEVFASERFDSPHSLLAVPIHSVDGESVLGVLSLWSKGVGKFEQLDIPRAEAVAGLLSYYLKSTDPY
jgi:hypothetical protein